MNLNERPKIPVEIPQWFEDVIVLANDLAFGVLVLGVIGCVWILATR